MAKRMTKAQPWEEYERQLAALTESNRRLREELAEAKGKRKTTLQEAMMERDLRYRAEGRAQAWEGAFLAMVERLGDQ